MWESCYVSLRQHRWVNRGFLHGPLLPIYGSGAIIILFATLPVENDLRLVWLLGMLAATVLEYVTGAVMERLFQVRYWDYSKQKFNLNGHICLSSSIAWGFFSILLVRFLHPPVGRLLADVPAWLVDPAAIVLTAVFSADVVRSVQDALDLKEILTRVTEENEDLRRLAKRAEVAAAFAEDDLRKFRERTEVEKLLLQKRIEEELEEQRQARQDRKIRRREVADNALRRRTAAKLEALRNIAEVLEDARDHLEDARDHLEDARDQSKDLGAQTREELEEAIARLHRWESAIQARGTRVYHRSLRILRANPSARVREELGEVLETLRKLGD